MANTTPVARVSAVEGQAFAKDKNGELRALHVGDLVFEGDVLVTAAGARVELAADDGRTLLLRANETLTVDAEVMASIPPDVTDAALQMDGADINRVVQAINEGGSLDALLDETAAGDAGGGADGGPTFVRLLRITEGVDPLGVEFGTGRHTLVEDSVVGGGHSDLVSTTTVTGTITDAADLPKVGSVSGDTVSEGTANTFTVTLDHASTTATTVSLAMASGSATVGTDTGTGYKVSFDNGATYTAVTGSTVTVPAGSTSFKVQVDTNNDTTYEGDETYSLTATANGGSASGTGTITDNDPSPSISVSSLTVLESVGFAVFTVSLSNASSTPTVLNLVLADVTATGAGADYGATSAINLQVSTDGGAHWVNGTSVTIAAGATSVLVRTPITDDAINESNETFTLTATRTSGTTSNASAVGTATIDDNDPATPILTVTNKTYSLSENFEGLGDPWASAISVANLRNNGAYATSSWLSDNHTGNNSFNDVEIGNPNNYGITVSANTGKSVLEIESWDAGEANNLYTNIATKAGEVYNVSFDAALRNDTQANGSVMYVYFGNQLVGTVDTTSHAMTTYNFSFVAETTGTSVLEFRAGDSNSYGVMMDNINVALATNTGLGGYYVNLPSIVAASSSSTDSTETLAVTVSGIPAGYGLSDGVHTPFHSAAGSTTVDVTNWDLTHLVLIPTDGASGPVALTVTATVTDSGVTSVKTENISLTIQADASNLHGSANADNLTGTTGNDGMWGFQGDDILSGGNGNDRIAGGSGNDTISGGSGNDVLSGGTGNDTIYGGEGKDYIAGGAGNDILSGGSGSAAETTAAADVFVWSLEDVGAVGTPARDTITYFGTGTAANGGDVLDLRDLLQGENHNSGIGNLANYINITTSTNAGVTSTEIRVSHSGGFTNGTYSAGAEDQHVTLTGVNLFSIHNDATNAALIQHLLDDKKLVTD